MRLRSLAALIALAAVVAGCGGSPKSSSSTAATVASNGEASKSATAIVADALVAARGATAVDIKGTIVSGGSSITLDLHLVAGRGGFGTVSIGGLGFQIVRIGPKAYFNASTAFWTHYAGATAASLFKGRWIEESALKGQLASFTPLTDIKQFFSSVLATNDQLKKGSETTVNGQPAIEIVDTTKGGSLSVATSGAPYPLELKKQGTANLVTFDRWNQAAALAPPPNAIEMSKLTG
jgi:hypothetical protein